MRFKVKTEAEKIDVLGSWHKKFAWLPVKAGEDTICWLEFVSRRLIVVPAGRINQSKWQYRVRS